MFNYLKKRFGEHSTTVGLTVLANSLLEYANGTDIKAVLLKAVVGVILAITPTSK